MKFSRVVVVVLAVLLLAQPSIAVISCKDVFSDLGPCLTYVVGATAKPAGACCNGFTKLVSAASTVADRRAACTCLVSSAQKVQPNVAAVQALSGLCGIALPYKVSLNMDCSKIS